MGVAIEEVRRLTSAVQHLSSPIRYIWQAPHLVKPMFPPPWLSSLLIVLQWLASPSSLCSPLPWSVLRKQTHWIYSSLWRHQFTPLVVGSTRTVVSYIRMTHLDPSWLNHFFRTGLGYHQTQIYQGFSRPTQARWKSDCHSRGRGTGGHWGMKHPHAISSPPH